MNSPAILLLAAALSAAALTSGHAAPNSDGEDVPAGESAALEEVKEMIRKQVTDDARKDGRAFRDAHRKHHGCVRATFTVRGGLPPDLAQGLFSAPASYPAFVRYSNGSGKAQDDHEGDGRGMAVKILGVKGRAISAIRTRKARRRISSWSTIRCSSSAMPRNTSVSRERCKAM